ncbi:neprilysin-2-like [Bradysia coprophila]|uniref:neprilysin-2-like n=1 Tax=Bradysia coprophila TaxID=38358 RepID=UPI00187DA912|nr:neprilysin-2-like [Bradysia coprophila]
MNGLVIFMLYALAYVEGVAIPTTNPTDTLSTGISKNDIEQTNNVCTTDTCTTEANRILNSLDTNIDPCGNFHDFACGNYIRDTVLAEGKPKEWAFSQGQDEIDGQMQSTLREEIRPEELKAFKLAKEFTKMCLDETTLNEKGIAPIRDMLEKYGGWPVVEGDDWKSDEWDWLDATKKMLNDGFPNNFILDITVDFDVADNTKNIITINRAEFGLEKDLLLDGGKNPNVKAYLDYMIDVAVLFGANRTRASEELMEVLLFEAALAQIEAVTVYTKATIDDLETYLPNFNWTDYINWSLNGLHHVNENETVVLNEGGEVIASLDALMQKVTKRTIANYMAWRVVLFASEFSSDELYKRSQTFGNSILGVLKPNPRSVDCSEITMKNLPIAVSAIYVRKFFNEESRKMAVQVAKLIHDEFLQTLNRVPWMDETTRAAAISKANGMYFHIGYPDELLDDKKLDEHYKDLELQSDSLLYSAMRIQKFNKDQKVRLLRIPVNKTDWVEHSIRTTKVGATYLVFENSIELPAAIFQDRFFSIKRPFSMNFGTLGFSLGHEITHGFDSNGRKVDSNGNMADWWEEDTLDKFVERSNCFIQQYSNYTDAHTTVNGEKTLDENIADNGGIKVAYAAYQKYVEKNGADPVLPGLNYTSNQLFWISGAQLWCSVTRPAYIETSNVLNDHTPDNFRIIGAYSNLEHFAKDFNCELGSKMNPVDKCEIW